MYRRVGTYNGSVPLQEMAQRLDSFEVSWAPDGHGTTVEHKALIRDAFRADLEGSIPGDWVYSMLVALQSKGGSIPMHRDLPQEDGTQRYHLVLQTNEHCWNFHDGEFQHLELGGIYTVDETREHASINWGDSPRIHLVVDAVVAQVGAVA